MSNEEHFRKLERMYNSSQFNRFCSPKLTISKGAAELIIPIQEKFYHAGGAVHGAVYFKILDDVACYAVCSLVKDVFVSTTSFSIHFFRPVAFGKMKAIGKVINASRNAFVSEASLFNDEGKEIARGIGSYTRSRVPLSPDIGYR